MNVLAFNIETIPDIDGGQRIHQLQGLDDSSTAKALFHLQQQQTGSRVLPLYLQRIAAISVVYRGISDNMDNEVKVLSLGNPDSNEAELLRLFFDKIEARTPTLVSWNGTGFDLPVIHYRSLKNNVVAAGYWETGENNHSFRHDNYLSRYHDRHTDLMDVLSSYNESMGAPLNDIALMLGFPGKQGLDDDEMWESFQQGKVDEIRHYSETAVLNTYLVYLQFQAIRGKLSADDLVAEHELLKTSLKSTQEKHLTEFAQAWEAGA